MSNKFAERTMSGKTLKPNSRMRRWVPLTMADMKMYAAIVLYQGIIWKPMYEMYYTTGTLFSTPGLKSYMSYNKFKLIDKFLHFVDNEELGDSYAKSAKIQPVWDYMNERYSMLYTPKQNIAIDESLLLWKGHLTWKQSILSKQARFGVKSFLLCESESGYIWRSLIYTGKEMTDALVGDQYHYVATKIVLGLLQGLLDKGYTLFVDNWYSSFELSSLLLTRQTDTIGTLVKSRKNLPPEMNKTKLKTGECVVYYEQLTNTMVTKWKDKKDVHTISTFVNDDKTLVRRAGKDKLIPTVVDIYNRGMGGVDKSDQMMTSYDVERKRVKKWYKKVFNHIINQCAQILHKRMGGELVPLKFRQVLVSSLLEKYGSCTVPSGQRSRLQVHDTHIRLIGRHFPEYVTRKNPKEHGEDQDPNGKQKAIRKPQRRCVVCKKRKETRFECKECDVGLCAAPCFMVYHTQKRY